MLGMRGLPPVDLQGLPGEAAALIAQMQHQLEQQQHQLAEHQALLQRKDREIAMRDAKLEKVNFELARLKRWKFGAKTEAMSTEQRRLFEETLTEDEASLQAQLDRLRQEAAAAGTTTKPKTQHGDRGARPCRRNCAAWNTTTNPKTPTASRRAAGRR
jgi:chromosome segregation ATPase